MNVSDNLGKISSIYITFKMKLFRRRFSLKCGISREAAVVFAAEERKYGWLRNYFPGYKIKFFPYSGDQFYEALVKGKFRRTRCFISWIQHRNSAIEDYARFHNVKLIAVEDAFLRSRNLGRIQKAAFSLAIDSKGIYYDATKPSDLEDLLNTFDFSAHRTLIERAKRNIRSMLNSGISKYNHVQHVDIETIYGPKHRKRILVIGQAEDDHSIKYGYMGTITNNDVVKIAYSENRDAEIIYKPHPDVLSGLREPRSNPEDVRGIAKILKAPLSISDALKTIDHVYTVTSLAGFEAVLRDIPTTTLGCPFYSGWGLTNARQNTPRRTRKLTKEEVFAASYILYSKYYNPYTNEKMEIEDVIQALRPDIANSYTTQRNH